MSQLRQKRYIVLKACLLVVIAIMLILPVMYRSQTHIEVSDAIIADKVISQPSEQPLHQVVVPDFMAISDTRARKKAFFNFLKPAIDKENARLGKLRDTLKLLAKEQQQGQTLSNQQLRWLMTLSQSYRVDDDLDISQQLAELLIKVDQIPRELVLVQAANESAWGSSRFAQIGLNFFGIWCFREGCGMVPSSRDSGLNHEVAAFESVDEVIRHYFLNLNANAAYSMLRGIRAQLREHNLPLQANILATGLLPYSERGIDYVVEINAMLRHNHRYL